MVRNAILLISTLAVLLLLFAGYSTIVGSSSQVDRPATDGVALPQTTQVADEKKLQVGELDVEPGEPMAYVRYDPVTGRPTDYFRLETWEKVPGTQNEVLVTEPELMMRLASGMTVTVTAERGQIKVERIRSDRVQPQSGWLAGNARIVVDRETDLDGTPSSEPPEGRITVELERLEFDLELGELKTAEPLRVISSDFEVTGTGLHLIWNQSDNRVEQLVIDRGGEMVLRGELLDSFGGSLRGDEAGGEGPALVSQPARPVARTPGRARNRITAYRCTFSGGISIDHFVGERLLGALQADELTLLFDIGGGARGLPRRGRATTSAPTSMPDQAPPKRLVLRWNGRLALGPAAPPSASEQPRRQFEARGSPVTLSLPNGKVNCSRLALHEETGRLWLQPGADGVVELVSGETLSVKAAGVYLDLESDVVKLIGDVEFRSRPRGGQGGEPLEIHCDLWAELHLAGGDDRDLAGDVFESPLASRPPESAVFVGDVRVNYQGQMLRSHRLDTRFRRAKNRAGAEVQPETAASADETGPAGTAALEGLLESAVATGDVRLTVVDPSAESGWRSVFEREADVLKRALIRTLSPTARGRTAVAGYEDRTLECARLRLDFALVDGEARVSAMHGDGAVRIFDRDGRFAARGREISATFTGGEELKRATVRGSEVVPALVRARAYALRGKDIEVDEQARTLHVDGRSRLAFRSRRSFQGLTRGNPEIITVSSNQSMRVDLPADTVHFIGQVVAGTGDEQLLADALTLMLENASVSTTPTPWSQFTGVVRALRGKLSGRSPASEPSRAFFVPRRAGSGDRKELARVLAKNAELRSVVYAPGDPSPLVYQSVTGPELEIDVRRRWIRTSGITTLSMTDRRQRGDREAQGGALGIPSALMSRGPSQTVMECRSGMIYALGEEGPGRKDSVLLNGGVRFRHVTGREMVDFERMLPEVAANPKLLETLKSRNSYLECDRLEAIFVAGGEARGPSGESGLRPSLQLSWLNARENVYLRDQQDARVLEVYAHQLEFDGTNAVVRVLGLEEKGIEAHVFEENTVTGRFSNPASGPEIIIDLEAKTVKTKEIRGRAGR